MVIYFSWHLHEHTGDYVIRANESIGSFFPLGAANGEEEARLICKTLNSAIASDEHIKSMWVEFFETGNVSSSVK